jgi:hypothetical protein
MALRGSRSAPRQVVVEDHHLQQTTGPVSADDKISALGLGRLERDDE